MKLRFLTLCMGGILVVIGLGQVVVCPTGSSTLADDSVHDAIVYQWKGLDLQCGPRCLWQIARAYGKDYSLDAITDMTGMDLRRGTTAAGMVKAAKEIGMAASVEKTNLRVLTREDRVAILLLTAEGAGHFAILDKIEPSYVRLLDGSTYRRISRKDLNAIWDGYAILIGDREIRGVSRLQLYGGRVLQSLGIVLLIGVAVYGAGHLRVRAE